MSLYIDQKYALMLPLSKFERKHHGKYYANFRCPICGDSRSSDYKKRCWFYTNPTKLSVSCFNCGYGDSFFGFIRNFFPSYYDEYIKELYFDKYNNGKQIEDKPCEDIFRTKVDDLDLMKVGDFPRSHNVIQYILNRKLPLESVLDCYYSDNFYGWCKAKQPTNFQNDYQYDKRLIFPFKDRSGNIFGLSGRSLSNQSPKYLTMKMIDHYPKVYGYEKLNLHKRVYITEGQIDSLFIDNCIGAIGALGSIDTICEFCMVKKENIVLVIDNEKRNKQTCNFIKKNLEKGYTVSLWPNHIKEKDINEMIMNGLTKDEIKETIDTNVVSGTTGLLKFANWRKI